jgi:hypothetical protein
MESSGFGTMTAERKGLPDERHSARAALRTGRAIAKQLAAECRALKGTGLITPGYWIQENREAVALILDAFADTEGAER